MTYLIELAWHDGFTYRYNYVETIADSTSEAIAEAKRSAPSDRKVYVRVVERCQ